MTKTKARKKPAPKTVPASESVPIPPDEVIDPGRVHELFGLPRPYETPKPPPDRDGWQTFWDPGQSVAALRLKNRELFGPSAWFCPLPFAKHADIPQWRRLRLAPVGPGEEFAAQEKRLSRDEGVPAARVVVTFLILRFLATGERADLIRLRCREVPASGKRVLVGPFSPAGLDLASVADGWKSPGVGLAAMLTPR
ncbi:MAG: hypothetical protein K2X87_25530 [Gemmataceae bacterium]|nr:hypothetical protein [Gemmataceae bacterium]